MDAPVCGNQGVYRLRQITRAWSECSWVVEFNPLTTKPWRLPTPNEEIEFNTAPFPLWKLPSPIGASARSPCLHSAVEVARLSGATVTAFPSRTTNDLRSFAPTLPELAFPPLR